jgi:flagellar protein FlaJ
MQPGGVISSGEAEGKAKELAETRPGLAKLGEKVSRLEELTLKRMKKKEVKVIKKKEKKPSLYVKIASSLFYDKSMSMIKKGKFYMLRRDLIRANMEFVPANYISLIFFTTIVSFFAAILVTVFFLFFSLAASPPFIVSVEDGLGARFLKVFWILFAVPAGVILLGYFYPSMEKKSVESKINQELPFATIHMSSISNSMIEPSKIFSIIISTGEYPHLEKEFTKVFNEVNIYGYDLVTALREMAFNCPSRKLAELYNGMATTITSGGNLPEFFDKRAQALLFDHRIQMEKNSKAAETFMDIYISVVIAAPMILMLLLVMMKLSGLGISLSTGMITLVMSLGVSALNVLFLFFLQLKQPGNA